MLTIRTIAFASASLLVLPMPAFAQEAPAANAADEDRGARPREPIAPAVEPPRREVSIRREPAATPAATTTQPGNALRAIRDRLQQR